MPPKIKKTLTAADRARIKDTPIPRWVNRDADVKMVEETNVITGLKEWQPQIRRPVPAYLRRKDMKTIRAASKLRARLKFSKAGETFSVVGGEHLDGTKQITFYRVVRAGTVVIREIVNKRNGHVTLSMGGTAVLAPEIDMTLAFDPQHWRKG